MYRPKKVYKAWVKVSFTTWVPMATIMAPGGVTAPKSGILGGLETEIVRSESESLHRSIGLPYVSPIEGIQSLGGGFLYYLGPNGDYYGSRGSKNEILFTTTTWRNFKGYKFPTKLNHYSYYP